VNRLPRLGVLVSAALLAAGATALSGTAFAQTTSTTTTTTTTKPAPKLTIKVGDNYFKPKTVTVVAGTKVKWVNSGGLTHSVKPNTGKSYGVSSLRSGKSYSYTFAAPGTYAYYCRFHGSPGSGQHATIVVKPAPTPPTTAAG
jgi:plastocyanin